jgi:hypothetical protein
MKSKILGLLAVGLLVGAISAPAALAAAPVNDTFSNATVVTAGFGEVLDTTEATTDSDDAQLNASCGAPATDASVWYSYTAAADGSVLVDVSQSNYTAGVIVGVGSQGNLQTVACGPGTVVFAGSTGTTYYVLAFDDQGDGGSNGGSLRISFNEVDSPVLEDLTVNRFGGFNPQTGVATISGSYTCSNGDFFAADVNASQVLGGRVATVSGSGFLFEEGTCDGLPHNWSVDVFPQSGKFAGGKSMTVTFAYSCGQFTCVSGFLEQTVQLRSIKKK